MSEDIKKTQKVILFPEDPEINKEVNQEVIISENGTSISIMHDGEAIWMSVDNFVKFAELIDSAFNELCIENHKRLL